MAAHATYSDAFAASRSAETARLAALAVFAGLAGLAALQLRSYGLAGVFEYPLDDVYIHLAMASGMTGGTYGVNPGEPASAASSILYPALLMPFAGTEAQRMLPLVWNIAGLAICAGLWGVAVAEARLPGWGGALCALAGPVALNMSGVAFLGMEHSLHAAASLATVIGLWRYLLTGRIAPWFAAALILAPLLRLEGLALSLSAAAVIVLTGRRRGGAMLALAIVLPVLGFMAALMAMGLAPLPSSVLVKLTVTTVDTGPVMGLVLKLLVNLLKPAGLLVAALVLAGGAAIAALRIQPAAGQAEARRVRAAIWVLAALTLAAAAHLVEGKVGWLHRYEHYIAVSLVTGLALATAAARGALRAVGSAALAVTLAAGAWVWLPALWGRYVWNPRAIHLQQAQMARFAQDFAREPVAVNDLGRVVWRNPDYVLDLWGLASERARQLRLENGPPPDGWADILTRESGVRLAIVYEHWIGTGIGAEWRRIGQLTMRNPRSALGGKVVAFFATEPGAVPELTAELRAFAATLPADAMMELE